MHSILFVLKKPDEDDREAKGNWTTLWQRHQSLVRPTTGVVQLGEFCWLIQADIALPTFCGLVAAAHEWQVPYRILYFDEPPQWFGSWKDIPELTVG